MLRVLIAIAVLAGVARAEPAGDAVALLPLDADRSLEIYGQPVAAAIARALGAGKIDVVVVGAKMDTPERAALIVDGKITKGAGGSVILSARVRVKGATEGTEVKAATAPVLTKIDAAASELADNILPVVRDKLAALHAAPPPPPEHGHVVQGTPEHRPEAKPPTVLVAIADWTRAPATDPMRPALEHGVATWVHAAHRDAQPVDASKLDPKLVAKTVATANAELAIGMWILAYHPEDGKLPMARGKVHVRVADAHDVLFDRVVVTDTVLGDPKLPAAELAARVADEVLQILRPHMRRAVRSWR